MYVQLKNINKRFGETQASDDVSFEIEKGKLIGLLGPSGSGKTTILRMIAGLEKQDSGDIYINGKLVNDLSPSQRGVGFVFQNYALFPYLTVYDNIAYGLKVEGKDKEYIKKRVTELLDLVSLPGIEKRYPDQLSGGQRQRIALARALAPEPELLLLDEPFAAIDAKVRQELRTWLRRTIDKIGITSIFVTHDQDEAIEVADEIVITNLGKVEQVGDPVDIYLHPKTSFTAKFIGKSSVLKDYDRLKGFKYEGEGTEAIIRPEFVELLTADSPKGNDPSYEEATVEQNIFRGDSFEVILDINGLKIKGASPLVNGPLKSGDKVKALINMIYIIRGDETYLVKNSSLDDSNTYFI